MSKTALLWLAGYGTSAIMAFVNPAYGLFGYFLDYYGHPPLRWWGKGLADLRWSLTISLVTLVALLINQNKLPKLRSLAHPQTKWLLMFVVTTFIVTPTMAVVMDASSKAVVELTKIAVLYFLIIHTIRSKEHFGYLIIIQIVGVFWWGWDAFQRPNLIVGGRLEGVGGADSNSSNGAAAHLLAIMPFIGVVFLTGKLWEKAISLLAAPFVLNAFVLCNSRGAFLGLLVTGLYALVMTKGRLRARIFAALSLGAILFYNLMDPKFIERQSTIQNYEDSSATSRIELWKGALNLIKDYPLGVGAGGYEVLSPIYAAEVVEEFGNERTVHNTYLLAASEWGIPGLVFFLAFLIGTFRELHRLRRVSPTTPEQTTLHLQSLAIELGLIGFLTAGIFSNGLYSEAVYWLSAFTAVLRNLYFNECQEAANR
jgi:putative inorganic carbon (hco3(-)) transporter